MRRLRRWLLMSALLTLTTAVALVAFVEGLEEASWLAGIGSLLIAAGTISGARVAAPPPQWRPVPPLPPPAKRAPGAGPPIEDLLLRLRRDHDWGVDRRAATEIGVVYWPIHLRPPTLIHAVQALVAAELSARGAQVFIGVEDLHEEAPASLTAHLIRTIEGWFAAVPGARLPLHHQSVRDYMDATRPDDDGFDPWRLAEAYFRRTTVTDVLKESKIVRTPIDGPAGVSLGETNAYRLLTAPAIWSVMHSTLRDVDPGQVVTLGGLDEQGMWERWHGIRHGNLNHLYNPMLDGLTHASRLLRWTVDAELEHSLTENRSLLRWVTTNAVLLPATLRGQPGVELAGRPCASWAEVLTLLQTDSARTIADIAQQASRLYLPKRPA